MKTKTKKRFRHSFDMWLRGGVFGIGNSRLESLHHANRPHVEADMGGGLYVRATAYADESAPVADHDIRTLAALAAGDVRRCSIYLSVYCHSHFVTVFGPHERGVIAIPSEMDAAAENLLNDLGVDAAIEAAKAEVERRRAYIDSIQKSLAAVAGGGA
jgi:hypothetical protein